MDLEHGCFLLGDKQHRMQRLKSKALQDHEGIGDEHVHKRVNENCWGQALPREKKPAGVLAREFSPFTAHQESIKGFTTFFCTTSMNSLKSAWRTPRVIHAWKIGCWTRVEHVM